MIPILLIEDQVELCQILKDTLSLYGFDVTYALNGEDGYNTFTSLNPKIVIIDIMMPGSMDGLDLCRLVKSDPSLGKPWVVLLTARGQSQDIEAGMMAGADAYLLKPFSPLKLIETINHLGTTPGEAP